MVQTILIQGIIISGIYALLASGFSLIFGVLRIINLAQTAFYMVTSYFVFILATLLGLSVPLASIVSIFVTILIGLMIYKLCVDRIREHETTVLLVTVAIAMVFQEGLLIVFGLYQKALPPFISGYWEISGIHILYQQMITLGIVVFVLLGIWIWLYKTKLGLATRALAQDREVAYLMGIEVKTISLIAFGVAVSLASVAGAVVAPLFSLDPFMWVHPLLVICAVVILGGLGSIKGSILGAIILGFVETLIVFLVPMGSFIKTAVALVIMIIMLLVRPEGLFGVVFEEERL